MKAVYSGPPACTSITTAGQCHAASLSDWMKQQLRRSYEYEVAVEWEAEMRTPGEAELLKSVH